MALIVAVFLGCGGYIIYRFGKMSKEEGSRSVLEELSPKELVVCPKGSLKVEGICQVPCDLETHTYKADGTCVAQGDFCDRKYFFHPLTKKCEQVRCPGFYYVGESGKECHQDTCSGQNEKIDIDGKTCICETGYARMNSGSCEAVPLFFESISQC